MQQTARTKLICSHCSFKFSRDIESKLAQRCPNCSSQRIFQYKPLTADYFLRSTDARR